MAVDLRALAAGQNVFANQSQQAVVYQAADPQGGYGCNDSCVIPPTPPTTGIRPSLSPTTCKLVVNLSFTGSTGATGNSVLRGLNQYDDRMFSIYEDEISCGDDIDFALFPPVTDSSPIVETGITGLAHLRKLNVVNSTTPSITNNITVRVTGLDSDAVDAQLQQALQIISMDFMSNLSVCMVTLNPNDCSICVNPTTSGSNVATFSPNCPIFLDDTHGYYYPILPGTTSVRISECIVAAEVVHQYTACGS